MLLAHLPRAEGDQRRHNGDASNSDKGNGLERGGWGGRMDKSWNRLGFRIRERLSGLLFALANVIEGLACRVNPQLSERIDHIDYIYEMFVQYLRRARKVSRPNE